MKKELSKKEKILNRIRESALPISVAELEKSFGFGLKYVKEVIREAEKSGVLAVVDEGDGVPRYFEAVEVKTVKVQEKDETREWQRGYDKGYADGERETRDEFLRAERRAYQEGRKSVVKDIFKALGVEL